MSPRYGVMREFKLKRDAERYAKSARMDGFGARVTKLDAGGYIVRRTDYPIRKTTSLAK